MSKSEGTLVCAASDPSVARTLATPSGFADSSYLPRWEGEFSSSLCSGQTPHARRRFQTPFPFGRPRRPAFVQSDSAWPHLFLRSLCSSRDWQFAAHALFVSATLEPAGGNFVFSSGLGGLSPNTRWIGPFVNCIFTIPSARTKLWIASGWNVRL
jgi:hypothetical protein